jgi:hypothetical protein
MTNLGTGRSHLLLNRNIEAALAPKGPPGPAAYTKISSRGLLVLVYYRQYERTGGVQYSLAQR